MSAQTQPDPADFETPVYEVWARSTVNDNRGDSRFRDVNGEDPGEAFSRRETTEDVKEARRMIRRWLAKPYTAAYVKVVWKRDEAAYREACERAQLAALKAKYPDAG
jgi:hypothetical protein